MVMMLAVLFFFFQAEDGIRDLTVTGVQTCALPISGPEFPAIKRPAPTPPRPSMRPPSRRGRNRRSPPAPTTPPFWRRRRKRAPSARSGERRVGEEGRSRWAPDHLKKKKENEKDCV